MIDFDIVEREIQYGDYDATLRYLVELVLFCPRGMIDRSPSFGSELVSLIFRTDMPEEDIESLQVQTEKDLNFWLEDFIKVKNVEIRCEENKLFLTVRYISLRENLEKILQFHRTDS